MKKFVYLFILFSTFRTCYAQLNVELLHQLIDQSKSEHAKQSDARDRQVETTANEGVNKTLLTRLKDKYRGVQSRFSTLAGAIDMAQIGMESYPILSDIATNQMTIFKLCKDDPLLSVLALDAQLDIADRAERLTGFIYGVCLSIGEINQMKPSDRKMLFSHVITELRAISGVAHGLATTLSNSSKRSKIEALNPFSDFINTDRKIIEGILLKKNILNH